MSGVTDRAESYIDLYEDRMSFVPSYPSQRTKVESNLDTKPTSPPILKLSKTDVRNKGRIIDIPDEEPAPHAPRKRERQQSRSSSFGIVTPFVGGGRRVHDKNTKNVLPHVFTPFASFSPSEIFYKSRTFLPSLQFTASVSSAQSFVPYVLYSAAGFVVFAVLTSFLFLKSTDEGYNLMTPSESADSRISDYASSTSTTVTVTGDSSSIVV